MIVDFERKHIEKCADIFFDIYKNEPFNYSWVKKDSVLNYFTDIFKTPKFRGFVLYTENGAVCITGCIIKNTKRSGKHGIQDIDRRR